MDSPALRVGLIGVGAIGKVLADALDRSDRNRAVLTAVADVDEEKAYKFATRLNHVTPVVSVDELISRSDLVVEAAGQAALVEIVPPALQFRKDLLIMSVGGLLGHEDWFREAEERSCRIHIPSGAIAGLDGLKAAAMGRLDSVTLTSRKPTAALRGGKYVAERGIDLDRMNEDTVIFEGPPEEACRAFPATSNVAASIRLAVGRSANFAVRIVASPNGQRNIHEIRAEGDFGSMQVRLENFPSESNPRTSQLAALSAVATLQAITGAPRMAIRPA